MVKKITGLYGGMYGVINVWQRHPALGQRGLVLLSVAHSLLQPYHPAGLQNYNSSLI